MKCEQKNVTADWSEKRQTCIQVAHWVKKLGNQKSTEVDRLLAENHSSLQPVKHMLAPISAPTTKERKAPQAYIHVVIRADTAVEVVAILRVERGVGQKAGHSLRFVLHSVARVLWPTNGD